MKIDYTGQILLLSNQLSRMNYTVIWNHSIRVGAADEHITKIYRTTDPQILAWIAEFLTYHATPRSSDKLVRVWDRDFFDRVMRRDQLWDSKNFVAKPNLFKLANIAEQLKLKDLSIRASVVITMLIEDLDFLNDEKGVKRRLDPTLPLNS